MAVEYMREPTLETLGLGSVIEIFKNGRLPVSLNDLVDQIFGPAGKRRSFVISGANGIVGAGKMMQFMAKLCGPFGIPMFGLDMAGSPDGISPHYPGLKKTFGKDRADKIMSSITMLNYDGKNLPRQLIESIPAFLLECIIEDLEKKKIHFGIFDEKCTGRDNIPDIIMRSVTSGFPFPVLGVEEAHPAFPHHINQVWEVRSNPSAFTHLLWALGMTPTPVSDHWSFVLDVAFCGLMLAALRLQEATNMPFVAIDKLIRKYRGPNPFAAHDAIGAAGANYLTWCCLYHLYKEYGEIFRPPNKLIERMNNGLNWYPPSEYRPLVGWQLDDIGEETFLNLIDGPLFQMFSLMLHEKRAHPSIMNAILELCALFRPGTLALITELGADKVIKRVEAYHGLHPEAAKTCWFPEVFESMEDDVNYQQLCVNGEIFKDDGKILEDIGLISIGRETINQRVIDETHRVIDWLKAGNIKRVILTGDFHLAKQHTGADVNEFLNVFDNPEEANRIPREWSELARRFYYEFEISIGVIAGKRCVGGSLELWNHLHYVLAVENAILQTPEPNIPVVHGMEILHWLFRKSNKKYWPEIMNFLMSGKEIRATEGRGWLVDFAGPIEEVLKTAWLIATDGDHGLPLRKVYEKSLEGIPTEFGTLPETDDPGVLEARKRIYDCIKDSCRAGNMRNALIVQSTYSTSFMTTKHFANGDVGKRYNKICKIED